MCGCSMTEVQSVNIKALMRFQTVCWHSGDFLSVNLWLLLLFVCRRCWSSCRVNWSRRQEHWLHPGGATCCINSKVWHLNPPVLSSLSHTRRWKSGSVVKFMSVPAEQKQSAALWASGGTNQHLQTNESTQSAKLIGCSWLCLVMTQSN